MAKYLLVIRICQYLLIRIDWIIFLYNKPILLFYYFKKLDDYEGLHLISYLHNS